MTKIKLSILVLFTLFLSATIFIACSEGNNEEIQSTTANKLNALLKSNDYNYTMKKMDEIIGNIDHNEFLLKYAINENNTFNDDYIKNKLSSTKYRSIQDFKNDFNELFLRLKTLKDK